MILLEIISTNGTLKNKHLLGWHFHCTFYQNKQKSIFTSFYQKHHYMNYDENIFQNDNLLNDTAKQHLLQTVGWTKFLAIVGFIFIGFMALVMLFLVGGIGTLGSMYGGLGVPYGAISTSAVIFIFYMVVYIYPIYCLYKFSVTIKKGIQSNNPILIAEGMRFQKNMYMVLGILLIIILSIYILFFLIGGLFLSRFY
jgi:magnesium-transporting ATPase (P-type)